MEMRLLVMCISLIVRIVLYMLRMHAKFQSKALMAISYQRRMVNC